MHHTPLLTTLAVGFVLAFLLGALANRLRISPLVGYLLAGVLAGPFTPGFVADQALSQEIAELGVILLMFGVGLHFSLKDLLSVKAIAIPGAVVQIGVATLLGMGLAWLLGWNFGGGLVFGLALSVASTVVLLRALEQRQLIDTKRGRIAIGWLIVEDLAMVLTLVLLPALAGSLGGTSDGGDGGLLMPILLTLGKVAAFVALMIVGGRRLVPWVLERVAATGSRELFTLAVLAIALGIAYGSAVLFGVSFALGAFFAGMMLNESELSHEAARELAAAARRVRGAVLRLGGHAVRSDDPDPGAADGAGDLPGHRLRQVGGGLPHRAHVRPPQQHRADHRRQPGADRRVLLHSGRPGHRPRTCCPKPGATWCWPARSCRSWSTRCCSSPSTACSRARSRRPRASPLAGSARWSPRTCRRRCWSTTTRSSSATAAWARW